MDWKRHFIEAATLIVAAVVCALTANAVASRERKLAVVPAVAAAPPRPAQAVPPPTPAPAATSGGPTLVGRPTEVGPPPAPAPTTATAPQKLTPKPAATATQAHVRKEFKPHPDKPYIEIHYDDVAALHNAGALFLDARRTSVYEQGHIAGARPFSVWESDIEDKVNKLFAERGDPREQEKPIVIYCSGGDCEDSHMLAQKLWGVQFNNAYVYKDGFPDWQKRGGAIHTGANP